MIDAQFYALSLPASAIETVEKDVIAALQNGKDGNGVSLFDISSVVNGFDAALLDSIMASPLPDMCPFVGINSFVATEESAQGGGRIHTPYQLSLYLLYYYGVPSADNSYASHDAFTVQRNRHIEAVIASIQMQSGGNPNAPIPVSRGWKWNTSQKRVYDFVSPFRYIAESYKLPSGFNCVRIDNPVDPWHVPATYTPIAFA